MGRAEDAAPTAPAYAAGMLDRIRTRVSDRVVDGAVAVVLAAVGVLELALTPADAPIGVEWYAYPFLLAMTLPVAYRRKAPGLVMVVVGATAIAGVAVGVALPTGAALGLLMALYTVTAHGSQRAAIWSGAAMGVVLVFVAVRYWELVGAGGTVANYLIFGTAWVLGWATRNRRRLMEELAARAETAERTREQEARRAVGRERARIARELHDIVAHSVSVMVVQAGAARRQLDHDPTAARGAIAEVERTGRTALAELRRLLGVLREERGDRADAVRAEALAPQPTLRAVAPLVETMREAGMPVHLEQEGAVDDIPAGIDVSAYRVVQEALTNVLKHAGTPSRVDVLVRSDDDAVEVTVRDDGRGPAPDADPSGHGLTGMRERVAVFGGELTVGARPGGGYVVRAFFPRDRSRAAPSARR